MGLRLIPSSGAAMAEGGIAFQVSGQDEAGCGELVTDEPEPEQPSPHGVFGILHLGLRGLAVLTIFAIWLKARQSWM